MKKNLNYRDQLLELAKIYKIADVKNYIKRNKYLTNSQLEHLLKKNKVPVPKNFNKNIFQVKLREANLKINKIQNNTEVYFKTSRKTFLKKIIFFWQSLSSGGLGLLNLIPKVLSALNKALSSIFIDSLNHIYNNKVSEKNVNKIVGFAGTAIIVLAVGLSGFTIFDRFDSKNNQNLRVKNLEIEKKVVKKTPLKLEKKIEPKKSISKKAPSKIEEKTEPKNKIVKKTPNKLSPKKKKRF